MSEISLLASLKRELVSFLDELIESFPNESDFVISRIFVKDQIPIKDIMMYVVTKLCPLYDQIKNRDEKFFLENNVLFEGFDNTGKVNHFRNLWLSPNVDNDDREVIWKWVDSLVTIAIRYKALNE